MLSGRMSAKVNLSVQAAIMMCILSLPADFFKQWSSGELASRSQQTLINGIQKIKLSGAEKRADARWSDPYAKLVAINYHPPLFLRLNTVISTAISLFGTLMSILWPCKAAFLFRIIMPSMRRTAWSAVRLCPWRARQRLMIARAIAPKPKILMFDEATSALDNITQKTVSESLEKLKCTRLVIAHRLSTIRVCDRIIYLEKGKIVEDGIYDELIALNGKFAELAERQRLDA